jgi:hypothetical protein
VGISFEFGKIGVKERRRRKDRAPLRYDYTPSGSFSIMIFRWLIFSPSTMNLPSPMA